MKGLHGVETKSDRFGECELSKKASQGTIMIKQTTMLLIEMLKKPN